MSRPVSEQLLQYTDITSAQISYVDSTLPVSRSCHQSFSREESLYKNTYKVGTRAFNLEFCLVL